MRPYIEFVGSLRKKMVLVVEGTGAARLKINCSTEARSSCHPQGGETARTTQEKEQAWFREGKHPVRFHHTCSSFPYMTPFPGR